MAGVTTFEPQPGPFRLAFRTGGCVALLAGKVQVLAGEWISRFIVVEFGNRLPVLWCMTGLAIRSELSLMRLFVARCAVAVQAKKRSVGILNL